MPDIIDETKAIMKASEYAVAISNLQHTIEGLMNKHFYGKLEVIFENGKIVHCKKTESIKI